MDGLITSRRVAQIGVAGLLLSILGLALALVLTIDRAVVAFRRHELSQAQIGAVLRACNAMRANDLGTLRASLNEYRRLSDEEAALPSVAEHDSTEEGAHAGQLQRLAHRIDEPSARMQIDAAVVDMIDAELREASAAQREMQDLRLRSWWLTGALVVSALISAFLGGIGLLRNNRRLASEVARRTAKISAIDASRRLFFAKASHELRTPVTVMRGEAEVALASPGAEAAALRQVIAQTDFLEHRVAELLALAQAEDGQLKLSYGCCNLGGVAQDAIHAVQGYAAANAIALELETVDLVTINCDCRWLTQAIVAILDNAVKFSNEGGVVTVRVERLSITVSDQGIGLMPEAIPLVFDAFYSSEAGARGGSGLGLALARWVVEQHGGTIAAANLDGGGCRIRIDLPESA